MTVENNTPLTYQENRSLWKRGFDSVSFVAAGALPPAAATFGAFFLSITVLTAGLGYAALPLTLAYIPLAKSIMNIYENKVLNPYRARQIQESIENSLGNKKSALIIQCTPEADPEGAFVPNYQFHNYKSIAEKHSINLVTGFGGIINEMESKKIYDLIVIKGHGTKHGIHLDEGIPSPDFSEKLAAHLRDHIKVNGKIVLDSCSMGKGDENLAQTMSEICPTATVYAAKDDINPLFSLYDENGNPLLNNWKNKDITRLYQNGRLIVDP